MTKMSKKRIRILNKYFLIISFHVILNIVLTDQLQKNDSRKTFKVSKKNLNIFTYVFI